MYKVVKDIGASENVYLQNTETMAELNLGRVTPALCRILEKAGYSVGETYTGTVINLRDKWNLSINDEVKEDLRKFAMPMKKPIRDQRKNKEKDLYPNVKTTKQPVDVLDIIYGLA